MSVSTPLPDEKAPRPGPRGGRALPAVLAVLACATQAFVLFATFVMGLGWGGLTYIAALVQAGAAFVPIAWLAARRRKVAVLVPVLSAALTAGLFFTGYAYERATACSDEERAAVQELAPPPGTTVEFEGEYIEGCVARTDMTLSSQNILEHYGAEFARLGWQETPGRHEAGIGTAAVKDGVQLTVDVEDVEGGGQMLETVVGDPATAAPCLINRVGNDASMSRDPTSEVELGQWMMFVSSDDLPASVVVRDDSGAIVFERQAHARPEDNDELMEFQDSLAGVMTLSLDEGAYEVECMPRDGAATVVPLRAAWHSSGAVEKAKVVVLRVFERPDHWE